MKRNEKATHLSVQMLPIGRIKRYAGNPRKNERAVAKVAASIQEFGWRQPIVVDAHMVIVAGDTRYLAALQLQHKQVPVHVAKNLTLAQVRAYRLADNRTGEEAEWDTERLVQEFAELERLGFDLTLTGFDPKELAASANTGDANPEEPWRGNIPTNPITQPGDLIELGRHRLLCGDSRDAAAAARLMASHPVQMACCDPPYGIGSVRHSTGTDGSGGPFGGVGTIGSGNIVPPRIYPEVIGDDSTDTAAEAYRLCAGLGIPVLIFWGANHYAAEAGLPSSGCWLVWDKQNDGNGFADCELAWTNIDAAVRVFRHLWNGMLRASEREARFHPNQKPAALARWCFERFGQPGDRVLDLFAGAGWTVLAAEATGRSCLAMELSPAYCDVIVSRWEQATGQQATRPGRAT